MPKSSLAKSGRNVVKATVSEVVPEAESEVVPKGVSEVVAKMVSEFVHEPVPDDVSALPLIPVNVSPESVTDCEVLLVFAVPSDEPPVMGFCSPHEQSSMLMQSNIKNIAFFIEIPSLCELYGIFILSV